MGSLLEIENLRVAFRSRGGEALAVRGATFSVAEGETVALVGESGCGKSVTAKSVMGLVRAPGYVLPDSVVRFEGEDVLGYTARQWDAFRGSRCAMVFQDALASLNPTMRVGRQLVEALDNHRPDLSATQKRERAEEVLRRTGVPDAHGCMRRYPHELSGGMRQRAIIASAMVANPRLLIADEPTTSLDVTVQAQTLELMAGMQRETGCAVLLVTHDMGLVAEFASRVVVMYAGRVVEQGPCEQVFANPSHPYTQALLASVPRLDTPAKQGFSAIDGTPPDPSRMPGGCAFAPRCPHAMNVCAQTAPAFYAVEDGRSGANGLGAKEGERGDRAREEQAREAACWLLDPRCPRGRGAGTNGARGAKAERTCR